MFWKKGKENLSKIISKAIGPAPWYWKTFPNFKSNSESYKWDFTGAKGEHCYLVVLGLGNDIGKMKIVLNTYSRALYLSSDFLIICFSENDKLSFLCFNLKQSPSFSLEDLPSGFKDSRKRYFSLGKPISQIIIDQFLEEGEHKIIVPKEFKILNEIVLVDSYKGAKDLFYAVYLVNPKDDTIRILPQKWFTKEAGFNIDYQWITRVIRTPNSKKLVGDGVRIGAFELTDDGCNLERWI